MPVAAGRDYVTNFNWLGLDQTAGSLFDRHWTQTHTHRRKQDYGAFLKCVLEFVFRLAAS